MRYSVDPTDWTLFAGEVPLQIWTLSEVSDPRVSEEVSRWGARFRPLGWISPGRWQWWHITRGFTGRAPSVATGEVSRNDCCCMDCTTPCRDLNWFCIPFSVSIKFLISLSLSATVPGTLGTFLFLDSATGKSGTAPYNSRRSATLKASSRVLGKCKCNWYYLMARPSR